LIAYLVDQAEEHIADAVADGRMTQEEADEKLADLEDHITELVTSDIPEPGDRPMGGGGGRGGHGPGGFGGGEGADA